MYSLTFRVNLELPSSEQIGTLQGNRSVNVLHPDMHQTSPDNGRIEKSNRASTRSTWLPCKLAGENRELKHGDTFTAYGEKAIYLRNMYVSGYCACDRAFLEIVS
jgi:hypothetical protein